MNARVEESRVKQVSSMFYLWCLVQYLQECVLCNIYRNVCCDCCCIIYLIKPSRAVFVRARTPLSFICLTRCRRQLSLSYRVDTLGSVWSKSEGDDCAAALFEMVRFVLHKSQIFAVSSSQLEADVVEVAFFHVVKHE
jgi:hypothetical protein